MEDDFLKQADAALTGWENPVEHLKNALQKDEFALYCQPIRALTGAGGFPMAETLVRLREEESALLPPGDFIPTFQHYKMMPQLDRWVVRKVLVYLRRGMRIPRFTVNLSTQTLEDRDFPGFVGNELRVSGVKPAGLAFEIDEPDLLARPEVTARCVTALKGLGCAVLIDGFGRQAASFAPLKSLGADFIKVDGSITRKVAKAENAANKMKAIVKVGEALRTAVVAECVEEEAVVAQLKAFGVGYAQGFGIARPLPIESLPA